VIDLIWFVDWIDDFVGKLETYEDEEEVLEKKMYKKWENAVLEKFDELEELDDEDVLRAFRYEIFVVNNFLCVLNLSVDEI
jgi:hypothetical protein